MAELKIYLNVPYAQKDAAKALGARWDAPAKRWYVPADKDVTLFAQWQPESASLISFSPATAKPKTRTSAAKNNSSANNGSPGIITYPTDKNFVAYEGDEPPWN